MPGTTNDAQARYDRYSSLEDRCGHVLLAGLLLETVILIAFSHGKKVVGDHLEVIAYVAVFGGVYGEIHFASKARQASDDMSSDAKLKIAEANARADEANLRTEELRAKFAWRIMNKEQFQTLVDALADMRAQLEGKLATWVYNSDEAANLAAQINEAIEKAGYNSMGSMGQSGGRVPFYGVHVDDRQHPELAAKLCEGLKRAGIEATPSPVEIHGPGFGSSYSVILGVSVKPPP